MSIPETEIYPVRCYAARREATADPTRSNRVPLLPCEDFLLTFITPDAFTPHTGESNLIV